MSSTRDQIYKPLRTEAHQIRLCSILPASFDDPIQCVLKIASLDEQPPYEALSYVWGDPSDCLPITVDSRNLPVTKNLECAMRYLRSSEKTRWVWIDALCINQDSIPERNAQVQLMHRIYSGAVLVVSWLGMEMAVHLKTAAEMIQYCREFPAALKPVVDDTYCEYWFRAWISQEVASAKRVIL
ncbi:heterokaryon incompatibility protein-domain-containing protein, partial [Phaeosphaeriaceae sp. PMI808]